MKILTLISTLIILGLLTMSDILAVTDSTELKHPYYTVQISYAGIGAEFRLNDIPFYFEGFSGQVDIEIPVGDKMVSGINELSIIVFTYIEGDDPIDDWHEDARVEATLYVREKNASKDTRKLLTHVKLHPKALPEIAQKESMVIVGQALPTIDYESKPRQFPTITYEKQIVISRKTHVIKTPFPRWEWQDGQTIENTPENYASLLEAYRKEYVIHQNQDLDAYKKSHFKLATTHKIINYYGDIKDAYNMLSGTEESWNSEEQELFEFIENEKSKEFGLKLDIIANGKLARIVDDSNIQPILYIIKSQRMSIKYKYNFYKNKQGEWIYIM